MNIHQNVDLATYNTMGVSASARFLAEVTSIEDLRESIQFSEENDLEILVLGGGSNLLFTSDFQGLVILNRIKGIEVSERGESVFLKIGAGENWHDLVMFCVERNWGGIENLSLIPGTVGAAPIQNIGAYGVELTDVLEEVQFLDLETKEVQTYDKEACKFGYRDSIFKHEWKGKGIIISVTLRLQKDGPVNVGYAALAKQLEEWVIDKPTIQNVSKAVIAVRQRKLPDPNEIGNNGSFFKNPVIAIDHFEELKREFPNIPSYPVSETEVKVPAGWLIDQAGWKGYRKGDAGVHAKQALVLVNYGSATGLEIMELSKKIKEDISIKYQIYLETEVNILI